MLAFKHNKENLISLHTFGLLPVATLLKDIDENSGTARWSLIEGIENL
jgi:hypothetical protein